MALFFCRRQHPSPSVARTFPKLIFHTQTQDLIFVMANYKDERTQEPDYTFFRGCTCNLPAQCYCWEFASWGEDDEEEGEPSQIAQNLELNEEIHSTTKTPPKGDQQQAMTKKRRLKYCRQSPQSEGRSDTQTSPQLEKDNSESKPSFPDELSP